MGFLFVFAHDIYLQVPVPHHPPSALGGDAATPEVPNFLDEENFYKLVIVCVYSSFAFAFAFAFAFLFSLMCCVLFLFIYLFLL